MYLSLDKDFFKNLGLSITSASEVITKSLIPKSIPTVVLESINFFQ